MSANNVQGFIGTIQEIYDFLTGGDSRMAAPIAKIFLCLAAILGIATYIMADKYFAMVSDSTKILVQNGTLNTEVNRLTAKLESRAEEIKALESKLKDCDEKPNKPLKVPTYDEAIPTRHSRPASVNHEHLIKIIND